jgi:hypothetical protein
MPENTGRPRMPTELFIRWASSVHQARENAEPGEGKNVLEGIEAAAKERWMRHQLTHGEVREYFNQMEQRCSPSSDGPGLPELLPTVKSHQAALTATAPLFAEQGVQDEATEQARAKQRMKLISLNDNPYGREYDAALTRELLRSLPEIPEIRQTAQNVGKYFAASLDEIPPDKKEKALAQFQKDVHKYYFLDSSDAAQAPQPRNASQLDADTAIGNLVRGNLSPEDIEKNLRAYYTSSMSTPLALESLPFFTTQLAVATVTAFPDDPHWQQHCRELWHATAQTRSRRASNEASPTEEHVLSKQRLHEGTTFPHTQPKGEGNLKDGLRMRKRPFDIFGLASEKSDYFENAEEQSMVRGPARQALEHGLPFACDYSGTTINLSHALADATQKGYDIDKNAALLIALVGNHTTGSHTPWETLWPAHQLNDALKLGLPTFGSDALTESEHRDIAVHYQTLTNPEIDDALKKSAGERLSELFAKTDFVPDYHQYCGTFSGPIKTAFEDASSKAWEHTLETCHRNLQPPRENTMETSVKGKAKILWKGKVSPFSGFFTR